MKPADTHSDSADQPTYDISVPDLLPFLEQDNQAGFSEALEALGKKLGVDGCIFWGVEKDELDDDRDTTYVLGEWLRVGKFSGLTGLALGDSYTGEAIAKNTPKHLAELPEKEISNDCHRWLRVNKFKSMTAFPLSFPDDRKGAFSLYWKQTKVFNEEELARLHEAFRILPLLYKAIQEKMSFALIKKTNRLTVLEKGGTMVYAEQRVHDGLKQVVLRIDETLFCLNTSLYLVDSYRDPVKATHIFSSWSRREQDQAILLDEATEGLIAWSLRTQKPLKLFDLRDFHYLEERILERYPGLKWKLRSGLEKEVRRRAEMRHFGKHLPPFSIIVVPFSKGGQCLGAICCFISHRPPFLFSRREETLLGIVADQISDYWSGWLHWREEQEEARSWEDLSKGIDELNKLAQEELKNENLDEQKLLDKCLRIARKSIKHSEILDVRLKKHQHLYFTATLGQAWHQGSKEKKAKRVNKRFDLDKGPNHSTGAWVFLNNDTFYAKELDDPNKRPEKPRYDETFPGVTELISSPIFDGERVRGVLDIRTTKKQGFRKNAVTIADLLAQQLGLHLAIYRITRKLTDHLHEMKEIQDKQRKTYEDFTHQIRTPVYGSHKRIQEHLRGKIPRDEREWNLEAIRGLCSKAARVVKSFKMFADLTESGGLIADLKPLTLEDLSELLRETAADTQIMIRPARNIHIEVNYETLSVLNDPFNQVLVDMNLLEQAIGNLCDNAAKYSYSHQKIQIRALKEGNQLMLEIVNNGPEITRAEIPHLTKRLYRGHAADAFSREGMGIGLWIVNHIMKAHSGDLIIFATTPAGYTRIRMILPFTKKY